MAVAGIGETAVDAAERAFVEAGGARRADRGRVLARRRLGQPPIPRQGSRRVRA